MSSPRRELILLSIDGRLAVVKRRADGAFFAAYLNEQFGRQAAVEQAMREHSLDAADGAAVRQVAYAPRLAQHERDALAEGVRWTWQPAAAGS